MQFGLFGSAQTKRGGPEVSAKLQALRDVGVAYVLLNRPGGLPTLSRFAEQIMPSFAG